VSKPSRRNIDELQADNARLKAHNAQLRRRGAFDGVTKIIGEAIRAARTVGPWYFIYLAIKAYAGRTSKIDVNANTTIRVESESLVDALEKALTSNTFAVLCLLIAAVALMYGRQQLKARQRNTEHLSPYQEKYEKLIDPKRSSSRLMPNGETRPGDE